MIIDELIKMYELADKENITVYEVANRSINGCSVKFQDKLFIMLKTKYPTTRQLKQVFAEELGHCIMDAFYKLNFNSECTCRSNLLTAERKAMRWAVKYLVPLNELVQLMRQCNNTWEIAEELNLDRDFIDNAIDIYQQEGTLDLDEIRKSIADYGC